MLFILPRTVISQLGGILALERGEDVNLVPNHQSRSRCDYRVVFGGSSVLYRCAPSPISGQFSGIEPWFYYSTQIFRFKPDKARAPETRSSSPRNPVILHVRNARP
jgi:hypothetical protein